MRRGIARFSPCAAPLRLPEQPFQLEGLVDALIEAAMEKFAGNKTKAAQYLGISRFSLHRRLQQKNERP